MTKLLLLTVSLIFVTTSLYAQRLDAGKIRNPKSGYVSPDLLKKFPTPVLIYQRDKAEYANLKDKIVEDVIYPVLNECHPDPIAAILIDFCPEIPVVGANAKRGCEAESEGKLLIEVQVWRWGAKDYYAYQSLIEVNDGQIDKDAWLTLFQNNYDTYVKGSYCLDKRRSHKKTRTSR